MQTNESSQDGEIKHVIRSLCMMNGTVNSFAQISSDILAEV